MTGFEKDFHKRLRRLAGVTDDTYRVTIVEEVEEGSYTCGTCYPDDYGSFDYGPSYKVSIYVHPENQTYWMSGTHRLTYEGMADLMRDLDEVEL